MGAKVEVQWIRTGEWLIIISGNKTPVHIRKGTDQYKEVSKFIRNGNKMKVYEYVFAEERIAAFSNGDFKVEKAESGKKKVVASSGEEVNPALGKKLVAMAYGNRNYGAFKRFNANLEKNPNANSRKQLYAFLERYDFPITQDGCFLAYKYVTQTNDRSLVDSYTRRYRNDPGCIVSMDRNTCCSDVNIACAAGLHVAAWEYASSCGSGSVLIEVKVNPKDVVSVPKDYSFQKIRCCRYEVLARDIKVPSTKAYEYRAKKKLDQTEQTKRDDIFEEMTAREIISKVEADTGHVIQMDLKNKKRILKKAREIYNSRSITTSKPIDLTGKTAHEIVVEVKKQTGETIELSLKNKKGIVARAQKILEKQGLSVKI